MATTTYKVQSIDGSHHTISNETPLPVAQANRGAIIRLVGTTNTLGVNTLVAAPGAGLRIIVRYFLIQNESQTGTTIILRDGGADAFRKLLPSQGDSLELVLDAGNEWELATNVALNLVLSGANQIGYSIGYWVE